MNDHRHAPLIKNLKLRAQLMAAVRNYFTGKGYLEVETPIRIPAPAPEVYIDAEISADWFLQTSPELCMKRLLATGFDRIFQICRCFRKDERGKRHLPEFSLLEWYGIGSDYFDLMDQCEGLIRYVAIALGVEKTLLYQGETVDLTGPWARISVSEAFDRYGSMSLEAALATDRFDEVMGSEIEPKLGRGKPVFLHDYPASRGALARLKATDPSVAERFELYICGLELCNGFSELTEADEQRTRFESEREARRRSGKTVYPMPERFLQALSDMPAAGGNALGLDRLVMLFADAATIDDVVAFTPEAL